MAPRRVCWPNCKVPEKRDFMDINPERTAEDWYKNYDPLVGIGTIGILTLFVLMISLKSMIRCTIRKYKSWTYDRKMNEVLRSARQSARPSKETVTFLQDDIQIPDPTSQNGMV